MIFVRNPKPVEYFLSQQIHECMANVIENTIDYNVASRTRGKLIIKPWLVVRVQVRNNILDEFE